MVCLAMDQQRRPMPLQLWLEFFRTANRPSRHPAGEPSGDGPVVHPRPSIPSQIMHTALMWRFPVPLKSAVLMRPHVVLFVVQALMRSGAESHAVWLTRRFVSMQRSKMSEGVQEVCRNIINVHLKIPYRGEHALRRACRFVASTYALHEGLRPDSSTVYHLLMTLKRTGRCGTRAKRLLLLFQRHWGNDVEDERVRRLIVFLAMREKRQDLVDWGWRKETLLHSTRKLRELESEILGSEWHQSSEPGSRRSWATLLPKTGVERKIWLSLQSLDIS
jgi:hypothetical protein